MENDKKDMGEKNFTAAAQAFEAIPAPVCIADFNDRIVAVNKAMGELFELPRKELLTMKASGLLTKESLEKAASAIRELVKTGIPQQAEVTGNSGKSKGRLYRMNMSLLKNEKGEPEAIVTVSSDITEMKKAREELRKRLAELEDFHNVAVGRELKMAEMDKEIERLKKELEQKG